MSNNFNAEAHYESKIRQGSIKNQSCIVRFNAAAFEPKKVEREKGLRRICKDQFMYADFVKINKIHNEYLGKLREMSGQKGFLENLYKAELTGAKVKIANKIGFIVEERKNSLVVIFEENNVKVFPKKVWDFVLIFEELEYLFLAERMKKGRMVSK